MMLSAGTQLGPYKIVAPLGRGGMGEVYRAKDTRLDREVAIKVLPGHLAADPDALKRFEREAKAVAALSHPNILTIHDVGSEQGVSFAVMELLEGETLRTVIGGKPVPWRKAVEIGTAIAEGLAAAHSKGIIHRDLKPENVFITSDDHVKILDFGLARYKPQLSQQELTEAPTESKLTESGIVMGTVPYMSPEQVRGESVDARTDIFAFGCVLYEMITGKLAFRRDTSAETISAILRDDPAELPADIPPELAQIIAHCLEKNSAKRFHSAHDLVFALTSVLSVGRASVPASQVAGRHARVTNVKRASIAAVTAIALAAIVALVIGLRKPSPQENTVPKIQSLAVLPLKNLSGDPKQEYFSDGMTEELIATLAKLESLRVISRSSVMGYKNTTKKIPEIAKELNVDAVIEGSVMQSGDRVRITAQLIHAVSDSHLWAETYERDLRDVFALQNDVAQAVAREIQIKLTPQEKAELAKAPQVNPEAYRAYLVGQQKWYLMTQQNQVAPQMFQRAVDLDPNFALAYAGLSRAHSTIYFTFGQRTEDLVKAKEAAERALELEPDLPQGHVALGYYYYYGYRDYEQALKEFSIALKSRPNDFEVFLGMALVYRRQGDYQKALDILKRALQLNPRDKDVLFEVGNTSQVVWKYREAEQYLDQSIALAPDESFRYAWIAWNYLCWNGDTRRAQAALQKAPDQTDYYVVLASYMVEMFERNYDAALQKLPKQPDGFWENEVFFRPWAQLAGIAYWCKHDALAARKSFDAARLLLERKRKEQPDDARIHSSLGIVYAYLGRKDEAIREGELAVKLLPVSRDPFSGTAYVIDLAQIYAITGQHDAALEKIEYLVPIDGSTLPVSLLRIDPVWDPLRSHPRFQKLLQKYDHGDNGART